MQREGDHLLSFRPHLGSLCGLSCGPRMCSPARNQRDGHAGGSERGDYLFDRVTRICSPAGPRNQRDGHAGRLDKVD